MVKGSAAGYLRTLFEIGAEVGPSLFESGLKAQAEEAARRGRQQEAEAKQAEAAKDRRERDAMEQAAAWFEALPEEAKMAVETAFMAEANPIDADQFRRKGRRYTGFRFFVQKTWQKPAG
jgi:hypothetical protein